MCIVGGDAIRSYKKQRRYQDHQIGHTAMGLMDAGIIPNGNWVPHFHFICARASTDHCTPGCQDIAWRTPLTEPLPGSQSIGILFPKHGREPCPIATRR